MAGPASALYVGEVRHRRREPRRHDFSYPLFMLYLDLDELPELFDPYWLWSARRPAPAWFRRADYLGDPEIPLAQVVRDRVQEVSGRRPEGPIRLLTHLRYFGFVMNPVSYYYCFDPAGEAVETVVAEITNTPWGERYSYVLDRPDETSENGVALYRVKKDFHVSPFLEMDLGYRWRIGPPGESLLVHIENVRGEPGDGEAIFDATLTLRRRPITGRSLAGALLRYPWMTMRVLQGIYWQALRLWLKRVPFHTHPDKVPVTQGSGGSER